MMGLNATLIIVERSRSGQFWWNFLSIYPTHSGVVGLELGFNPWGGSGILLCFFSLLCAPFPTT